MFKVLNKLFILLGFFLAASPVMSEEAVLRVECLKTTKNGCVADYRVCYNAPQDLFIKETSISEGTIKNHAGVNPFCGPYEVSAFEPFLIDTIDPPIETKLPVSFCVPMRIASGPGDTGIGSLSHLTCSYTFNLGRLPN